MKRIILSLSMIVFVGAVVIGATGAFFSDTETSTGNTFTAGAIDLGIDNESYYNGAFNPGTSWALNYDLDNECPNPFFGQGIPPDLRETIPCLFFNFSDLKPGDWGEDTISLHVNNNDSWLCADVTLTSDNDNDITEPEDDDGDNGSDGEGELADAVNFYWWADDGDNVYERCVEGTQVPNCVSETLLPAGPLGNLSVNGTATVDLADWDTNIWGDPDFDLPGGSTRYIGKAWCFGDSSFDSYPQDGLGSGNNNSPIQRPVLCDGLGEGNETQTDSMTANISFRAVQSRNNANFECNVPQP